MNIDSKSTVCGLPALELRKLLLSIKSSSFDLKVIRNKLKFNSKKAQVIIDNLLVSGYIEKDMERKAKIQRYIITLKGSAFALASAAKPYKRVTVDKAYKALMERVEEINSSDQFLHEVTKVTIFGSYLSNSEYLGDLDVVIEIAKKISDFEEFMLKQAALVQDAINSGEKIQDDIYELHFSELKTRKYLKNRSPILSIHSVYDGILKIADHKTIYQKLP